MWEYSGSPREEYQTNYYYDVNECLSATSGSRLIQGGWRNTDSTYFVNDAKCRMLERKEYVYQVGWTLMRHLRMSYAEDTQGNLLETKTEEKLDGNWVITSLEAYEYDPNGYKILSFYLFPDGSENREQVEYSEDYLTYMRTIETRESGEAPWKIVYRLRERQNENGQTMHHAVWAAEGENEDLVLVQADSVIRNENDRVEQEFNFYRLPNGNFTLTRIDYQYRCDGLMELQLHTVLDQKAKYINIGSQERYLVEYRLPAACETELYNDLRVFPNPASEYILVTVPDIEAARIRVSDMSGRIIYDGQREAINNLLSVDVSGWENGIYILEVRNGPYRSSTRVVVRH